MYRWEGKKMYTLLIADDEPLIRNGVKKIIDWESLGIFRDFSCGGWTGGTGYYTEKSCGSCADRYCDAVYGWSGADGDPFQGNFRRSML